MQIVFLSFTGRSGTALTGKHLSTGMIKYRGYTKCIDSGFPPSRE